MLLAVAIRRSVPSVIAFTTAVMAFVVATTLLPQPGRAAAPLLPRAVLGMRPLRQGAAGGLLNTLTTSSAITLATLYLQNTLGHSPLVAGLMLLPFSVAVIAGSALAAPALVRWAPQRLVSTGLAVIAVCDAALIPAARRRYRAILGRHDEAGAVIFGLKSPGHATSLPNASP